MENALQVIKSTQFNGIKFDCYAQENDANDFWATREQIGQLLGYSNPHRALSEMHSAHVDRLGKFSTIREVRTVEGNRTVTRNVLMYNFKGLLEICRYSNQPKANDVMDFLWDIADEIRKTGAYVTDRALNNPEFIKALSARLDELQRVNDELREQIAKDQAVTTFGKIMFGMSEAVDFQTLGQIFAQYGFPFGRNRAYKLGRDIKWLCKQGRNKNHPTQRAIEQGFLVWCGGRHAGEYVTVMVTPKSIAKVADILMEIYLPIAFLIEKEETNALKSKKSKQALMK